MIHNFKILFSLFLLMGIIFFSGCTEIKSEYGKSEEGFVEFTKIAPDVSSKVYYFNFKTMPTDIKDFLLDKIGKDELSWIDTSKIDSLAIVDLFGEVMVLSGDFEQDKIIKNLKEKGFSSSEYDTNKWMGHINNDFKNIYFLGNKIIYVHEDGVLQYFIDVKNNKRKSINSDQDIQQILDKIPIGSIMMVQRIPVPSGVMKEIEGYSLRKGTNNYEITSIIKASEKRRIEVKSDFEIWKTEKKKIVNQEFKTEGDFLIITTTGEDARELVYWLR